MNKLTVLIAFILFSLHAKTQNLAQCDSLLIQCCSINTAGPNTIVLQVANSSSYLFIYPGFVLFNMAMDTIAKETVTYFGIGSAAQPHTLNIFLPLILPFTGFLNLYTNFYSSFACSFPFTIADTASSVVSPADIIKSIFVFPNPVQRTLKIKSDEAGIDRAEIYDMPGKRILIISPSANSSYEISADVSELISGIYFIKIFSAQKILFAKFVKQ